MWSWSDELNEYTYKLEQLKTALFLWFFALTLCHFIILLMVRGRERATSMEIEAAFRVKHKIADTPPAPPPPPRKKTHAPQSWHAPQSCSCLFFLMFSPGVCIWTTPARVGATIDRQLFWLHFFVVVLTVANSLTVANFTFFKLFVYLSNCYHLCYFFFVSLLLAEVYFQILWSPCKWFLLNTLTRVHVNYNLHFATPFICSCVGLTADSLGRVCIPT